MQGLNSLKTFYAPDRLSWRKWLRTHFRSEKEIWLVYFKKATGKPRVDYNDAVEEALCFGWIDSTVRSLDNERFAQRFSPRNPKSAYSQANKERLKRLLKERKVARDVVPTLGDLGNDGLEVPADILRAVRSNAKAWRNFQNFSPSYKRIRIAFIEGARRRPTEFRKRLAYFIKMTEIGRQFGFGGIEKYY